MSYRRDKRRKALLQARTKGYIKPLYKGRNVLGGTIMFRYKQRVDAANGK